MPRLLCVVPAGRRAAGEFYETGQFGEARQSSDTAGGSAEWFGGLEQDPSSPTLEDWACAMCQGRLAGVDHFKVDVQRDSFPKGAERHDVLRSFDSV